VELVNKVEMLDQILVGVVVDLLIPFDDLDAAARTVSEIIRRNRIVPAALELMGRSILETCRAFLKKEIPHSDAEAHLLVELDGNGALLGVRHSGSFAEVTGMVYLREAHGRLIRWIRVRRYRIVSRPADWAEPELVCHEVGDELDAQEDDPQVDAGVETE